MTLEKMFRILIEEVKVLSKKMGIYVLVKPLIEKLEKELEN